MSFVNISQVTFHTYLELYLLDNLLNVSGTVFRCLFKLVLKKNLSSAFTEKHLVFFLQGSLENRIAARFYKANNSDWSIVTVSKDGWYISWFTNIILQRVTSSESSLFLEHLDIIEYLSLWHWPNFVLSIWLVLIGENMNRYGAPEIWTWSGLELDKSQDRLHDARNKT